MVRKRSSKCLLFLMYWRCPIILQNAKQHWNQLSILFLSVESNPPKRLLQDIYQDQEKNEQQILNLLRSPMLDYNRDRVHVTNLLLGLTNSVYERFAFKFELQLSCLNICQVCCCYCCLLVYTCQSYDGFESGCACSK